MDDTSRALLYYDIAVQRGDLDAAVDAAEIRLLSASTAYKQADAVNALKDLAGRGCHRANWVLGRAYLFGDQIPQDCDKAARYFKAMRGHKLSAMEVHALLWQGWVVPRHHHGCRCDEAKRGRL